MRSEYFSPDMTCRSSGASTVGRVSLKNSGIFTDRDSTGGGRHSEPDFNIARQELSRMQGEPSKRTKMVRLLAETQTLVAKETSTYIGKTGSKSAVKFKAALNLATSLLKSAKSFEVKVSQKLTEAITSNAAKVSAELIARTIAQFKEKQKEKTEADLEKAVAGLSSVWQKNIVDKKLHALVIMAKAKKSLAVNVRTIANAKAMEAVSKAAYLTKARVRKVEMKGRAKAVLLDVMSFIEAGLANTKAAMKADLVAV